MSSAEEPVANGGRADLPVCSPDVLEELFRRTSLGVAVVGPDFAISCHNASWLGLTGLPAGRLPSPESCSLAAVVSELVSTSLRGRPSRRSGVPAPRGRHVDLSALLIEPSDAGRRANLEPRGSEGRLRSEGARVVVVVVSDASERVEAQAALRSARRSLEQRVDDRTRELSTLLEVTRNLSSTLEPKVLLGQVLDQLRSVVAFDGARIYRLEGSTLRLLAHRAPDSVSVWDGFAVEADEETLDGEVIATRRPLIIDDVRGNGELARAFRSSAGDRFETMFGYVRSWMSFPLVSRGQVIGTLSLDSSEPGRYNERQAELTLAFAAQVAVAIENAELYDHANRRAAQLAAVQRVSAAIAGTLELPSVLQLIAQAIQTAAGYECAMVSLVEGEPPVLRRVASVGLDPEVFEGAAAQTTPLPRFFSVAERGHRLGGAYFFPGTEAERWSETLPSFQVMPSDPAWRLGRWHPQNMLIEPLVDSRGRLVGIISVDKPYDGRAPTAESVEILDLLAHQATIAIVNARLYEGARESAVAAERSRLARDLHDAVTQTLFSASLIAEVLPRLYERDQEEGRRRIEEIRQLTRGALAEMRTLLLELRPSTLTDAAFPSLMRQLAEATTGRARIPVSVAIDGEPRLSPDVQVALYRVAQEALNNVAKHSEASHAVVTVQVGEDHVDLSVVDDGRGFDVRNARPDSLGIGIMRERVESIGATLAIESAPGKGTAIRVRWSPR